MTDNATLDAVENAISAVSEWLAAGHAQPNIVQGIAKLRAIRAALADLSDALDALTDAGAPIQRCNSRGNPVPAPQLRR